MLLPPKLQVALNIVSILFAAFFFAPTVAIVASWNALPGDQLYPTKRTLERIALAVTAPNYGTQSTLQTKLIARRTSEAADDVLKKSSSKGLDELRLQAAALRLQITRAPTQKAKRIAATQAVRELRRTQVRLAQTRQTLTRTTRPVVTSPSATSQPPAELADDIEDTEDDIDDTIEDIEDDPDIGEVPLEPSPTPTPTPNSNPLFGTQGDTNTNDANTNDTNTNDAVNNNGDHPASSPPGRRNPQRDTNTPDQTPQDASGSAL